MVTTFGYILILFVKVSGKEEYSEVLELPILAIIVPCYNEEDVLPITAPLFLKKIQSLIEEGLVAKNSRIVFVDDGSKDDTWKIISNLSKQSVHCTGLRQSRNRGHQNAVYAGLMESKNWADITISIDCDGQDDIDAMDEMIFAYMQGAEIVYGVRNDRDSDKFLRKQPLTSSIKCWI